MKRIGLLLAVLFLVGFLASSAYAIPVLDFNIDSTSPAGVSISYAILNGTLVGSNVGVDSVTGSGTPLNNAISRNLFGAAGVNDARLNFVTGNLIGTDANDWFFGRGGVVTVVGGVDLNNNGVIDGGDVPLGTVLVNGFFTTAEVTAAGSNFKVAIAAFVDIKDPQLAAFYGLVGGPEAIWQGHLNLSFLSNASLPPSTFASTQVLSGDLTNSPVVPEPGSLLLIGSGLLAIAAIVRRKRA